MNFLKFPAESAPLLQYLIHFVKRHQLLGHQKKVLLAISGGPDSMALFCLTSLLKQQDPELEFRVLTIHHHSRLGQDQEVQTVLETAKLLGLEAQVLHIDAKHWTSTANFEARASKLRRQLIKDHLRSGEVVFTGHHLDDSFEWYLMQMGRSSDPSILGLPLVNAHWRRPFLCLTKQQIFWLLKWSGVKYHLDPSNLDPKHDRNGLRAQLIAPWKRHAPALLRHYVARSNLLAMKLGLHRLNQDDDDAKIVTFERGVSLMASDWSARFDPLRVEQMREIVKVLSNAERGELTQELFKICQALRAGRQGPHLLSGAVRAYLWGKEVFFLSQADLGFYEELDQQWEDVASEIPEVLLLAHPLRKTQKKGMKTPHPLFPKTTRRWLEQGISFQTPARAD